MPKFHGISREILQQFSFFSLGYANYSSNYLTKLGGVQLNVGMNYVKLKRFQTTFSWKLFQVARYIPNAELQLKARAYVWKLKVEAKEC